MKRNTRTTMIGLLLLLSAAALPLAAQQVEGDRLTAEIRIRIPDGIEPLISIEPGERIISVLLPRGSQFPMEFTTASKGLIRTGSVTPQGDGRLKLDLELAQGVLDRIDYTPDGVALQLGRRTHTYDQAAGLSNNYKFGPDDVIGFTVHNQEQLNAELTVTAEGTIFVPLVGETYVEGMTPRQVAILLSDKLGRSYLVDPQVDIDVKEFRSQWVMVTGMVQRLGRVGLRGGTRLKEVLSEAGGFTIDAGETITISSKKEGSDEYEIQRISRTAFERGEVDPMLNHGDIIDVAHSEWAYIQGEVRGPSRIAIERGLTLMRAIAMVGGLTEWANRKEVRILYPLEAGGTTVELHNLKRIQLGKDPDPALHGGETIIIDRRYF